MKNFSALLILVFIVVSCGKEVDKEKIEPTEINPAAEGFNIENSDAKAIYIADSVMVSMGGRKAWDDLKIIKWNFFGARNLTWNKHTGDVRIDFPENDSNVFITNIFTHKGKIKLKGKELVEPDSVKKYIEIAESMWINDSYWLFMPFKLKDSKTTLKYLDMDTTDNGAFSYKLQLTFNDVGVTPENKYWVYVDTTSMLVSQWSYFSNNSDTLARFSTPWIDYQQYGNLLLSGNRGERKISEIEVLDTIETNVFENF